MRSLNFKCKHKLKKDIGQLALKADVFCFQMILNKKKDIKKKKKRKLNQFNFINKINKNETKKINSI